MKNKNLIFKLELLIIILSLPLISFYSCSYASDVEKNAKKQIVNHKKFIHDLEFAGIIYDMKFCNECNSNRYVIVIKLNQFDDSIINIGYKSFQPYYFFYESNFLNLSLNNSTYNKLKIGLEISKKQYSNLINVDGDEYVILSEIENMWIP